MKKIMLSLAVVFLAGVSLAAAKTISLAEARKLIGAAIEKPERVTAIMKLLAPADQVSFVSELNAAVATLPGSTDDKTATYLSVNSAAINGASKGNLTAVVAEVFATASVESLTVINETFASEAFNRASNPNVTYTDEQFKSIAANVMKAVNARVASADNADVRSGFAALMMIGASNTKEPEMVESMTTLLPESAKKVAREEWFTAALSDGDAKSYEPMLGMANAEEAPSINRVVRIAGVQQLDTILSDLAGSNPDPLNKVDDRTQIFDAVVTQLNTENNVGMTGAGTTTATPETTEYEKTAPTKETIEEKTEKIIEESIGYQLQQTR